MLLNSLAELVEEPGSLKIVWTEHDGRKRTMRLDAFLKAVGAVEEGTANRLRTTVDRQFREMHPESFELKLNDCYVASLGKFLRSKNQIHDATAHLSLSPNSMLWACSLRNGSPDSRKPVKRQVISRVVNLERCLSYHKGSVVPTVLELTLSVAPISSEEAVELGCAMATRMWSKVACSPKLGLIDIGHKWLFFPSTGYNPNNLSVAVFDPSAGGLLPLAEWKNWQRKHNVSIEETSRGLPRIVVHTKVARSPAK